VRGMGGENRGWAQELDRRAVRQMLHSSDLSFRHPATGEEMSFRAAAPDDMASVVEWAKG
ncbi:MAG: hypothetical protein KJN92_16060, partial [Gemmatimonadetes bacterium]|nr:hypothetical protein [Gemmatimonadota bacterium]